MRLVNVKTMREVEEQANSTGYTFAEMMQKAGTGLAERVDAAFGSALERRALGVVGTGNNGGDTLIALAWLARTVGKPQPTWPNNVPPMIQH